jgi:F-type H+-transporting ATPase subunit b
VTLSILADSSVNLQNPILPETPELIIGIVAFGIVFYFLAKKLLPNIRKTAAGPHRGDRGRPAAGRGSHRPRPRRSRPTPRRSCPSCGTPPRTSGPRLRPTARRWWIRRGEANKQKEAIIASAHNQLEADRNSAVNVLKADLGKLATELADKIVGERAQDAALQERIIDRFLDELDAKLNASQKVS